jgi:hypothetical protein
MTSGSVLNGKCTPCRIIVKVTSKFSKKQFLAPIIFKQFYFYFPLRIYLKTKFHFFHQILLYNSTIKAENFMKIG